MKPPLVLTWSTRLTGEREEDAVAEVEGEEDGKPQAEVVELSSHGS